MFRTREQWLHKAVELMTPWFGELELSVPHLYIGVSYPSTGGRGKTIGVCSYHGEDGKPHVSIHPRLDDPVTILATVLHELVHATVGPGHGHGRVFSGVAKNLGLTGKMTATVPTGELEQVLGSMARHLGPYPHSKIDVLPHAKQSTRMIKVVSGHCGYTVRTTQKWLDQGMPKCPHGEEMELG